MTNLTTKIVKWAANQDNGHGAHISALLDAIKSGQVDSQTKEELKEVVSQWSQKRAA